MTYESGTQALRPGTAAPLFSRQQVAENGDLANWMSEWIDWLVVRSESLHRTPLPLVAVPRKMVKGMGGAS